ncbi:MAG: hypothetical protein OXO48_03220 [Caldilineaceae bacterium]|nr:hypothetical protein [Caldilineaceae bacterium]
MSPNLAAAAAEHPFPDYQDWWPLGSPLLTMMARAVTEQWCQLASPEDELAEVQSLAADYVHLVYARTARPTLASSFYRLSELETFESGEFDALSYAFFRSAFSALSFQHSGKDLNTARRQFTQRVGARFFAQLTDFLTLDLPLTLSTVDDFIRLRHAIARIGKFLKSEGYLRSHFAFHFDVHAEHAGRCIQQPATSLLPALRNGETAYALYEMGHPVILPSAVYLYRTVGEAQHHSSRTIEELFARAECDASETEDFDPSGFPSSFVVELWEIRRRN